MAVSSTTILENDQLAPVRLVLRSALTVNYYNGPSDNGVGATLTYAASSLSIDGVAVELNDRILFVAQTNGFENGIYDVTSIGSEMVFTRSNDFQSASQMRLGKYVYIQEGDVAGGKSYTVAKSIVSEVGVDTIAFWDTANLDGLGVKAAYSATWGGGGTSNAFSFPEINASDVTFASIFASTNPVSITKVVPTANTLTVDFSADPGAGTIIQMLAIPA